MPTNGDRADFRDGAPLPEIKRRYGASPVLPVGNAMVRDWVRDMHRLMAALDANMGKGLAPQPVELEASMRLVVSTAAMVARLAEATPEVFPDDG